MQPGTWTRRACTAAAIALALSIGERAAAQSTPAGAQPGPDDVEEIVVEGDAEEERAPLDRPSSGSRLDLDLDELSRTVLQLSGDELRQRGAADYDQALRYFAGVNPLWRYGGFQFMTIRGFSDFVNLNDGVRDDRHTIVNSAPQSGLWGIDRIDLLKGPAAVLYGHSAIGGVSDTRWRWPSETLGVNASVATGSARDRQMELGVTGPIGRSGWLYRLDAGDSVAEGFRGNRTERSGGTLALEWNPSETQQLRIRVRGNTDHYATDAGIPTRGGRIPAGVDLDTRYNAGIDELAYRSASASLQYALQLGDSVEIRESFSAGRDIYRYFSTEFLSINESGQNVDRGFFFFKRHWFPIYNQIEARLRTEAFGLPSDWVVGHGYGRLKSFSDRSAGLPTPAPVNLRNPVDPQGPVPVPVTGRDHLTRQVHSVFLDGRTELSDALSIAFGVRYDHHNFDQRRDQEPHFTDEGFQPLIRDANDTRRSQREDIVTYNAGAVYHLSDAHTVYGSYTTGVVPITVLPEDGRFFDPEHAQQVEIGYRVRNSWLSAQLAAYRIRKEDILISLGANRYTQAGRQSSRGIEASLELNPTARWMLRLGYAYTRARFDDFRQPGSDPGSFVEFSGNRPRFVPDSSVTLFTTYDLTDRLSVGLGGRWTGESFADLGNAVSLRSHVIFDASLWYEMGPVRLSLHLLNALDERDYFNSTINSTQLTPGPPREFLVQLDYTP